MEGDLLLDDKLIEGPRETDLLTLFGPAGVPFSAVLIGSSAVLRAGREKLDSGISGKAALN